MQTDECYSYSGFTVRFAWVHLNNAYSQAEADGRPQGNRRSLTFYRREMKKASAQRHLL